MGYRMAVMGKGLLGAAAIGLLLWFVALAIVAGMEAWTRREPEEASMPIRRPQFDRTRWETGPRLPDSWLSGDVPIRAIKTDGDGIAEPRVP